MPFGFFNSNYSQNRNQPMQRTQMWGQPMRQQPVRQQQQMPQQMPQWGGQQMSRQMQTPPQNQGNQGQPKPLPDGVNYQPLDEKTLAEIRRVVPNHPGLQMLPQTNGQEPTVPVPPAPITMPIPIPTIPTLPSLSLPPLQESQAEPQVTFTPAMPTFDSRVVKALESFIQGEHNGYKYYHTLANRAGSDRQKQIITGICESCKKRGNGYNSLYRNFTDTDYAVSDVELMGVRSFRDGVYAAIYEESNSLRELSDLYGEVHDEPTNRALMSALYRKVSDINFLQLALYE